MAERIMTPADMRPKAVTLAELRRVLLPKCHGWKWAEDAIVDLWRMGAPVPGLGHDEVRILLPSQFRTWWAEVQQRMGLQMSAEALHAQVHG